MSVTFYFKELKELNTPMLDISLANTSATWLLRLAQIDHDPECPAGVISREKLFDLCYLLEQYIIGHPGNVRQIYHIHNLARFNRLLGTAEVMGWNLYFG